MIITVTSPRKRMGQTITSINLCAIIAGLLQEKVILTDMNTFCKDVEYYLSDTYLTKGLDDFYSLCHTQLLDRQTFETCVKNVQQNIDIMAANECFGIGDKEIDILFGYVKKLYKVAIFDAAGFDAPSRMLTDSDMVVVVINQARNVIRHMEGLGYYKHRDKLVFVVNNYSERIEGVGIKYKIGDIIDDLRDLGYENPVFPLDYDPALINECNDQSVLNNILNFQNRNKKYIKQLQEISRHILKSGGMDAGSEPAVLSGWKNVFRIIPHL